MFIYMTLALLLVLYIPYNSEDEFNNVICLFV